MDMAPDFELHPGKDRMMSTGDAWSFMWHRMSDGFWYRRVNLMWDTFVECGTSTSTMGAILAAAHREGFIEKKTIAETLPPDEPLSWNGNPAYLWGDPGRRSYAWYRRVDKI